MTETFEAERAFLEKVDRILSGSANLSVEFHNYKNVVGFQRGAHINLNPELIKEHCRLTLAGEESRTAYFDFIKSLKGINYHELAHYLFTHTAFPLDGSVKKAYNVLEDSRIENYFSKIYPKAAGYFKLAMLKLADVKNPINFLITHGKRFFLPDWFVQHFDKTFTDAYGKDIADEAKRIIDGFLVAITFEERHNYAKQLATLMDGRLDSDKSKTSEDDCNQRGMTNSKMNKTANEQICEDIEAEKDTEGKGKNDDKSKKSKDDKKKSGSKKSDDDESDDDESDDDESDDDESDGDESGEKSDDETKQHVPKTTDEAEGMQSDEIELAGEELADDVEDDIKSIRSIRSGLGFSLDSSRVVTDDVPFNTTEDHANEARKLSTFFKKIRCDLSSGYINHKKSGRLDVRGAMRFKTSGKLDIFRKYQKARMDKARLAISILIDASGSMSSSSGCIAGNKLYVAKSAAWSINEALTSNDLGHTNIILFDTYAANIKSFMTKSVDWQKSLGGNTDPTAALIEASRELEIVRPHIKNRALIIITDGQWNDNSHYCMIRDMLDKLKHEGVHILILFIGNDYEFKVIKGLRDFLARYQFIGLGGIMNLSIAMREWIKDIEIKVRRQIK